MASGAGPPHGRGPRDRPRPSRRAVVGARIRGQIESLSARYELASGATVKLTRLLEMVVADATAPTAIRDPARVLEDHLADSLVALEVDEVRDAVQAVDLGAGAGFPGLPLAIALPALRVTLLESTAHKCEFMERVIDTCEVPNAAVVCARAESWGDGLRHMDLVTARALAALPVVIEYAAPLLRVGGALLAWRGKRDPGADDSGARAAEQLGMERRELRAVRPYAAAEHRHLDLMVKVRETPSRFPRRPGVAVKRPL